MHPNARPCMQKLDSGSLPVLELRHSAHCAALGPRSAIEIRHLRGEGVAVVLQAFPGAEPRDIDPGAEE